MRRGILSYFNWSAFSLIQMSIFHHKAFFFIETDAIAYKFMLESQAADLAGQKADETAITKMQYLIDEMQKTSDIAKIANLDFNLVIATTSKDRRLSSCGRSI